MDDEVIINEKIKQVFGQIFQNARLNQNLTQEQVSDILSKSAQTISRIETAKDGTSKNTDIDFMNLLEISPNRLYKDFIINDNLQAEINLSDKIGKLSHDKRKAAEEIIDILIQL